MLRYEIRLANADDISAIARIERALGRPGDHSAAELAQIVGAQRAWIACEAGQPVGYATIGYLWEHLPLLQRVRVSPAAQRAGAGRALVETVSQACAERGCDLLLSSCDQENQIAVAFHQGLGFKRAGELDLGAEDTRELFWRLALPTEQGWFWSERWQAGECQADAEIASGRVQQFESSEQFLAALEQDGSDD